MIQFLECLDAPDALTHMPERLGGASTEGHLPLPPSFPVLSRALESVRPFILLGLGSKNIVIHYGDKLYIRGKLAGILID